MFEEVVYLPAYDCVIGIYSAFVKTKFKITDILLENDVRFLNK